MLKGPEVFECLQVKYAKLITEEPKYNTSSFTPSYRAPMPVFALITMTKSDPPFSGGGAANVWLPQHFFKYLKFC